MIFDTVHHDKLLNKLKTAYNLSDHASELFRNYLTDRKQRVITNNIISSPRNVATGVPQGSCLGPLLFIFYINNITSIIKHSQIILFADDTVIYHTSPSFEHSHPELQKDLTNLDLWCRDNLLQINVSKTKTKINPRKKNKSLQKILDENKLQINNMSIEFVSEYKYLGVWIDSDLTFAKHVKSIISNVSFRLKKLSRIRSCVTKKTALLLYKSMIVPLYDYGDTFYNLSCKKDLLRRLQSLQNYAIRTISRMPPRTNTSIEEKNLELLSLDQRRKLHSVQLAFYLGNINSNLQLPISSGVSTRSLTRNRKQLRVFTPKKALTERSFSYQVSSGTRCQLPITSPQVGLNWPPVSCRGRPWRSTIKHYGLLFAVLVSFIYLLIILPLESLLLLLSRSLSLLLLYYVCFPSLLSLSSIIWGGWGVGGLGSNCYIPCIIDCYARLNILHRFNYEKHESAL